MMSQNQALCRCLYCGNVSDLNLMNEHLYVKKNCHLCPNKRFRCKNEYVEHLEEHVKDTVNENNKRPANNISGASLIGRKVIITPVPSTSRIPNSTSVQLVNQSVNFQQVQPPTNSQTIYFPIINQQLPNNYILVQNTVLPEPQQVTVKPEIIELEDSDTNSGDEEQFVLASDCEDEIDKIKNKEKIRQPNPFDIHWRNLVNGKGQRVFKCPKSSLTEKSPTNNTPLVTLNKEQKMFAIERVTACYGKESDFTRAPPETSTKSSLPTTPAPTPENIPPLLDPTEVIQHAPNSFNPGAHEEFIITELPSDRFPEHKFTHVVVQQPSEKTISTYIRKNAVVKKEGERTVIYPPALPKTEPEIDKNPLFQISDVKSSDTVDFESFIPSHVI